TLHSNRCSRHRTHLTGRCYAPSSPTVGGNPPPTPPALPAPPPPPARTSLRFPGDNVLPPLAAATSCWRSAIRSPRKTRPAPAALASAFQSEQDSGSALRQSFRTKLAPWDEQSVPDAMQKPARS